jgi:RNA polymerase sigma-70 factor (ECF subfamily)
LLVASLTRELGDFDLAEDAVQDAILEALRHWPDSGAPREPGAWLRVTARRKATDRLRHEARRRASQLPLEAQEIVASESDYRVADDRLVLIFMLCHPALSRASQVALIARALLGLTTQQVAKAFLTSEATMTKRIVRAKRTLAATHASFTIPVGAEARERLGAVLSAVYLLFNEGYLSAGSSNAQREELAADAEWLASLLLRLLPDEPEVIGLLALIRLSLARQRARFDVLGDLVLLEDQDRARWNRAAIDDALALLNRALRLGRPGLFQAQAAIAACHAKARRWQDTNWTMIVSLYDQLLSMTDSPVVRLNRAIALLYRDGPEVALAALDPLCDHLSVYHLYHAARAQVLRAAGRTAEAVDEDQQATRLTANLAELRLLQRRLSR